MQYKSVKGFTGFGQLGILLVFLGLGFILAGAAQLIVGMQMLPPGTSMETIADAMMKAMLDPENVSYARLAQVLGTFFLMFIPAVLYSWITNGKNPFWLGFNQHVHIKQILIGFVIIFVANILASPIADLTKAIVVNLPSLDKVAKNLEETYNEQVVALSNLKSWPEFIMAIAIMAFFPALFEEMFFRGAVQNLLERWWKAPLLAILVTSLLFSLVHMSVYLFLSRVILGFVLGLMYHQTKNIWVNVIAHFLNNAIAVSQLFYLSQQKEKLDVASLDPKVHWSVAILAVFALYYLFRVLNKYSVASREKINAIERSILSRENTHDPFSTNEIR
jgi:uncharacterized protein